MKIKELVLRYKVFLILLVVNVAVGFAAPEIGMRSLAATKRNLLEMLSIIPPVFLLLGLLDVWVDRATMIRYTGKGSGLRGMLLSFLLGSAAAGPLYAAFPVASMMLKKGSSIFNVLIFVGAWSTTKIPMVTFEAANLGLRFTLTRLCLNILGIILIAVITEHLLTKKEQEELYRLNEG